jgi:hypothetical protein
MCIIFINGVLDQGLILNMLFFVPDWIQYLDHEAEQISLKHVDI